MIKKKSRVGEEHSTCGPDSSAVRSLQVMTELSQSLGWSRDKNISNGKIDIAQGLPNTRAGFMLLLDGVMKKFAGPVLEYYGVKSTEENVKKLAKAPDFQDWLGEQLQIIWAEDRERNKAKK